VAEGWGPDVPCAHGLQGNGWGGWARLVFKIKMSHSVATGGLTAELASHRGKSTHGVAFPTGSRGPHTFPKWAFVALGCHTGGRMVGGDRDVGGERARGGGGGSGPSHRGGVQRSGLWAGGGVTTGSAISPRPFRQRSANFKSHVPKMIAKSVQLVGAQTPGCV